MYLAIMMKPSFCELKMGYGLIEHNIIGSFKKQSLNLLKFRAPCAAPPMLQAKLGS
jgi:hypothetical protein